MTSKKIQQPKHQLAHWVGGIAVPNGFDMTFKHYMLKTESEIMEYINDEETNPVAFLIIYNSMLTYDCWWYSIEKKLKQGEF